MHKLLAPNSAVSRLQSWLRPSVGIKRAALTIGAAFILAAPFALANSNKPAPLSKTLTEIAVRATPIAAFDKENPAATRFGKLAWRGGLVLRSATPNFGGWSGLALGADGKQLVAVSDAGTWMTADVVYKAGKPTALKSARLGPLKALSGRPLRRSRDRDAEALTLVKGSVAKGRLLISFEHNHRVGLFDIGKGGISAPRRYLSLSAVARRLGGNSGLEGLAILQGGRFKGSLVAFSEQLIDSAGALTGWIWVNGKPERFKLNNGGAFSVTDAAPLPDGGLLVLERRFRWTEGVKMRLRLIRAHELRPGATITGELLLDAGSKHQIDNMEGLAVHKGRDGEIIVTMISDNNFNSVLQRTILLQFALKQADVASAPQLRFGSPSTAQ
jgi:hypothetical protein